MPDVSDDERNYEARNGDDEQAIRLASLMVGLASSRTPIPTAELRSLYYPDASYQNFVKRFQRDRKSLAACGVIVREVPATSAAEPARKDHDSGYSNGSFGGPAGRSVKGRAGASAWTLDRDATFAPDDALTREEATLIDITCMPLANDPSFAYRDELTLALAKINRTYTSVAMRREPSADGGARSLLSTLVKALQECHPVEVSYEDAKGKKKPICLAIYGTFGLRGNTYFVACEYDRGERQVAGEPRTYRLDRFRKAKLIASQGYTIPEDFHVGDYVRLPFQMGPQLGTATFDVNGSRWTAPVYNLEIAAAWAIDQGIRPIEPAELVSAWRSRLQAAVHAASDADVADSPAKSNQSDHSDRPAESATTDKQANFTADSVRNCRLCGGLSGDARAVGAARKRASTRRSGRRGGLTEARELAALIGALDGEGATIDAEVVADRLGCTVTHAKHLLSMLIDASDEQSLYRLPLAADDDLDQTVLAFPTFRGRPLRLTLSESIALVEALSMAGLAHDDPLYQKVARALATHAADNAQTVTAAPASTPSLPHFSSSAGQNPYTATVSQAANQSNEAADPLPKTLQVCTKAIAEGTNVTFTYAAANSGTVTQRLVTPRSLRHEDGAWYLDAIDLSRRAGRSFRLDRMSHTAAATSEAQAPDLPASTSSQLEEPTVRFILANPRLAQSFAWNRTCFEQLPDGSLLGTCPYFGGMWLPRRLAACGDSVTIEDEKIRRLVSDYASSQLA